MRRTLAGLPLPKAADGRIVLAVDVSHWLRPDAPTSGDQLFCHVYGRGDRSSDQLVPGWPYSFVAALESGRTSSPGRGPPGPRDSPHQDLGSLASRLDPGEDARGTARRGR